MISDAARDGAKIILAELARTKSHKPQGDQKCRAIHMTHRSPFRPDMRYVRSMLQPRLDELPHILRDTNHAIEKLRCTCVSMRTK